MICLQRTISHSIEELLSKCTAVVLGPGLGTAKETEEAIIPLVRRIIAEKKPLVLDADAIKPVGENLHSHKEFNNRRDPACR